MLCCGKKTLLQGSFWKDQQACVCTAHCGWMGMGGPGRTLGLLWEVQALLGGAGYRPSIASQALMLRPLGTKGSCLGTSQKVFEWVRLLTIEKAWLPVTPCSDPVPWSL